MVTEPRKTWSPGGFPAYVTLAAQLTLIVMLLNRGVDYGFGDSQSSARRLGAVEAAAPLHVWGTLFILAGGLGVVGIVLHRAALVFNAHLIAAALYLTIGVGIVVDSYHRRGEYEPNYLPAAFLIAALAAFVTIVHCRTPSRESAYMMAALLVVAVFAVAAHELDGLRNASILLGVGVHHGLMAFGTAALEKQRKYVEGVLDGPAA